MPRYEQIFRDICALANSKRITDRKKFMTKLKELYDNKEAIEELDTNSKNKEGTGTNWMAVMYSVHKVILHEADRSKADNKQSASTSKLSNAKNNKESVDRKTYSATMLETIKKANSSGILLNCNDIVSLILQIFSTQIHVDYQKTYLTILINHVLSVQQYQAHMSSNEWEELLKHSIALYENAHFHIDKSSILQAIHEIVRYGCMQSHLALYLKNIFSFLVKVFHDAKSDPRNLAANTFKVANAVCQEVGPESRMTVCEFGETVMQYAINFNGGCAKYDWILLIVQAHHPGGVTRSHDAAYACDWENWTDILRLIYCMVINDCKSDFISDSFVRLACEVSWQLKDDHTCIDESITIDEGCYSQPSKRRRTVIGVQGMIDVLTASPLKESKFSVQILVALVKRYPGSIGENNFLPLLEFLNNYLNTCRDEDIMDQLWELGGVMVEFEAKLSNSLVDNGIKFIWDKLLNITLRSVSTNKNEEQVHKFLQSLISHKKVTDSNAVLDLYLKDTITWSKSSVHTLLIFCRHNEVENCIQPSASENGFTSNNHMPIKVCLSRWVLAIPQDKWNAQFPIEDICELLVGLTLKSWYKIDLSDISNTPFQSRLEWPGHKSEIDNFSSYKDLPCDLTNMESIHLLTAFENLCNKITAKNISQCQNVRNNVLFTKLNRDSLIKDLVEKNASIIETEFVNTLIIHTAIIAKVFSNFKQLNIIEDSMKASLVTIVKNSLQEVSLSVNKIIKSKKRLKRNNLMNVLEALHLLYSTPYQNDVADIIRSSTEFDMLLNIFLLTHVEKLDTTIGESEMDDWNTNVTYLKNMEHLSERHKFSKKKNDCQKTNSSMDVNSIRLKACTVLTTFCNMVNSNVMSQVQKNLQITLLNSDNYDDLTQTTDFQMAVTVLESLTNCESVSLTANVLEHSLILLQQLCRIWYKDNKATRSILNILSSFLIHVGSIGSDIQKQNSLRILNHFHKMLQKNMYGPMTHITFINCLETIGKIDRQFVWAKLQDDTDVQYETPVVQNLLTYIQSPFHVVRLKAISCLRELFASNDVNLEWLRELFSELGTEMKNLFLVQGELEKRVKADERLNRIATALHTMAVVVSCSAIFRSEALLFIFKLTVDNNVNTNIVNKILEKICQSLQITNSKSLVEDNLNYLLTHWLEEGYALPKFPVSLAHCKSEQQFYQRYINIVIPIIIQKRSLKEAHDLCNEFNISFEKTIENCFPRLISWLLPHISADPSLPPTGINIIDISHAIDVFNQLNCNENELQRIPEISVLLERDLENVILTIIKRLHDEQNFMQFLMISVNYPRSDPPHFKYEDIERSFKHLENNMFKTGQPLMYHLATDKQHVLQKVLLNLKSSIHVANSVEHKLKALHHYVYFFMMITDQIKHVYFDEMSAYVVRDMCHTLVHFINGNLGAVAEAACSYLYHILKQILPKRHEAVKQNLRLIVNSIVPIVKTGKLKYASTLIEFLIVKQKDILEDAIERLDSFPKDKVFLQVREIHSDLKCKKKQKENLENEIQHFLNTRVVNSENCSIAEIEHLMEQLSTKKIELKEMYQRLGSVQRFSEDCATSILHQLICALIKLAASSSPDISLRAAKCLGELGPADLSTMILQPEKDHPEKLSDPTLFFTYKVLVHLSNFLISSDVQLFTASSKALHVTMNSSWGQQIALENNFNNLKLQFKTSQELLQIDYIRPFIAKRSKARDRIMIDKVKFENCTNENSEMHPHRMNIPHNIWITNITCNILDCFNDSSYFNHLIPVCRANVSFCEKIFPWIIYLVLRIEKQLNVRINDNINWFFDFHFTNSNKIKNGLAPSDLQKNTCFDHKSVWCMLNVVDLIRSQSNDNCWFELNYLHIAKAAQYCSAYFTSVLYAELWCERFLRNCPVLDCLTPIDYIYKIQPEDGKVLQEILREACIRIGDPDAIYGCGTSCFENSSAKIEHYVQLRKWDKVLLTLDIELALGNKAATRGLLNALQNSGLWYLLGAFVKNINKVDEDIDTNYQYECAWRLSDWNMPTCEKMINLRQDSSVDFQNIVSNDYPLFHYHTLKSFHECDTDGLKTVLNSAHASIIKMLRNISLESCKTVYPILTQLQMLREVEEAYFANTDQYNSIIEKWNIQDSIGVNDFEYIEPILSQRAVFLQANKIADDGKVIENFLIDTYLGLTELSQNYGYFQTTARALGNLVKQRKLSAATADRLQYEEAILAWTSGDQELGRHLLYNLIVNSYSNENIYPQALTTYGNWMAETKSENPQKIINKYYQTSLEHSKKIKNLTEKDKKILLDTHAALAQFADVQYQRILNYMKSPQFESFKECIAYSEKTAGKLFRNFKDNDEKKAACYNKKQSSNDMVELENIEKEKNMYLLLALKHYICTLQQGEDHNLLVFRLISLWLNNTHHEELNELLKMNLKNLPSYKFILLVPQLAPHMANSDDVFSVQIYDLLARCAIDHPHHTLSVLLSLMNSHKHDELFKNKKKRSSNPEPRVLAAKKLIENLMSNNTIRPIIQEMQKMADALIFLANWESSKSNCREINIPSNSQSILQIKNCEHAHVPTLSLDVKPNKVYDKIVSIKKYDKVYQLVGGINAPKKIMYIGTDGIRRNQLVKGRDDLRQDAVMQQVFNVMNMLLRANKEAVKRKLSVRTYKVVPLTQRCGILEWCDNTIPFGQILEGFSGSRELRNKYFPNDHNISTCREKMKAVSKKSNEEKLRVFMDCCKHLHPVFHYFFLENFTSPEVWFERRLAYVHSIATSSIIGYIMGLGDRHMNNILIDKSTAEVIHIDFGIAFDQGKVLPTPETVPFRLTRNVEAAMGVSGVEGVLRRSCEKTMTVLRCHREVIITLLQVLLYDPLYSWAITPAKAYSLQEGELQGSSEHQEAFGETNKLAERALLRLEQKLMGTEEGSASSVSGQVEKLIQEARDPANLCRLFCGWQPYL